MGPKTFDRGLLFPTIQVLLILSCVLLSAAQIDNCELEKNESPYHSFYNRYDCPSAKNRSYNIQLSSESPSTLQMYVTCSKNTTSVDLHKTIRQIETTVQSGDMTEQNDLSATQKLSISFIDCPTLTQELMNSVEKSFESLRKDATVVEHLTLQNTRLNLPYPSVSIYALDIDSANFDQTMMNSVMNMKALSSLRLSKINLDRNIYLKRALNLPILTRLSLTETNLARTSPGTFDNLTSLWSLDLSKNRLSSLPEGRYRKNLEILILSDNQLQSINNRTFEGFENLLSVNLSGNPIQSFTRGAFHDMENLQNIIVPRNLLNNYNFQLEMYNSDQPGKVSVSVCKSGVDNSTSEQLRQLRFNNKPVHYREDC